MKRFVAAIVAAVCVFASPAHGQRRMIFEPVGAAEGSTRYRNGNLSVESRLEQSAVQVFPLGLENNRLTFGVAVINLGSTPSEFGIENIRATVADQDIMVLTAERLRQQAERRAGWAAALTGLAGGLSAAAAASQTDTYSATTYTPRGTYRTIIQRPSVGGQIAAAGITAGTAYSIANIQNQLDQTLAMLGDEIVQTTTIDPEDSYGGRFVLATMPRGHTRWPQQVTITITYQGEQHPFTFNVTRADILERQRQERERERRRAQRGQRRS